MSDIVERLREQAELVPVVPRAPWKAMAEAADEITSLRAQVAGLESTYDVKVAPVVHYSYRCYSCDTRWECRTESADCPLCGTTNFPCAPGDAA